MPDRADTTARHRVLDLGRTEGAAKIGSACLVVIHGGGTIGRRIELGDAPLNIGRSPQCELQLDEESVSRQHARIDCDANGAYAVEDLGSTNGTIVNDVGHTRIALKHGDEIQIGRSILKFFTGGHVESAYHEEIYRLMITDGLTNLMNRRAFEEALGRELGRAVHHKRPVCVAMLDIDHFKNVNDQRGHLCGDAVLRQLGAVLRTHLRRDDTAGRLGGEEFAMILPEVDLAGGLQAAEKIRRVIAMHRFEFDGERVPVTVSIGLVERGEGETDSTVVLGRADERLYAAKHAGRNCVCS